MKQQPHKETGREKIFRNMWSSASITIILILIMAFLGASIYIGFSSFMSR